MRFPLLVHSSLAALLIATSPGAINAEGNKGKSAPGPAAETLAETTEFHREGRAFFPEQGCSFMVMKGWRKEKEGDSMVIFAPGRGAQMANIIISAWAIDATLEAFAAKSAARMEPQGYKVDKPEPFETEGNLKGLRFRAASPDGKRVGVQYLFPAAEGFVLTLTGTFDPKHNAPFERVLTQAMKSLHVLAEPTPLPEKPGQRIGDKRASLQIPEGWDPRADVKGVTAFSPPTIHHHEQIYVSLEQGPLPLRAHAEARVAAEKQEGMTAGNLEEFETAAGVQGLKTTGTVTDEEGVEVRYATYYFDAAEGLKILVRASADAALWPPVEKLFDACAKTLRVGAAP